MILILSHEHLDEPTNSIIDWLSFYNADFIRLNGEDFSITNSLKIDINNKEITNNKGQKLSENEVNVIWYRRWATPEMDKVSFQKYTDLNYTDDEVLLIEKYQKHLLRESTTYNNGIFSIFKDKFWIPKPHKARGHINKLDVLIRAKDFGLLIPNTIITSSKRDVIEFLDTNNSIITKPIYEANTLTYKDVEAPFLTKEVTIKHIEDFPDIFFPSLFQKNIVKEFEIRSFIHRKNIYSMAMFSQRDQQTNVDFRNYNTSKPNRYVPFLLPKEIEKKLFNLLEDLDLNTGSIDLILDEQGNYVFLEINPVGQFGMVSLSCNYDLEKMVAEDLIEINKNTL